MRAYGWKPDVPDRRDRYLQLDHVDASQLPVVVSLRDAMPPVWDQGALGACTAFAIGGSIAYERKLQDVDFEPSFLHTYYFERVLEGTVPLDVGAYIRDGAKIVAQCGVPPAHLWPYVESKFAERPPKLAQREALETRVSSYQRVPRRTSSIRSVLAAGDTIVFGISVYESFESSRVARTGIVPVPAADEVMLGGHAVLMVGYDHERGLIECRNSWGAEWGDEGYFFIPYEFIVDHDLSDDFWVLKTVTEPHS